MAKSKTTSFVVEMRLVTHQNEQAILDKRSLKNCDCKVVTTQKRITNGICFSLQKPQTRIL